MLFAGISVVLEGDFAQILPVVLNGSKADSETVTIAQKWAADGRCYGPRQRDESVPCEWLKK